MEPQSSKECIEEIVRLASMLGWTFGTLDPEDKSRQVDGMVIGTEAFCNDAVAILTNVLNQLQEELACTMKQSLGILDADGTLLDDTPEN